MAKSKLELKIEEEIVRISNERADAKHLFEQLDAQLEILMNLLKD